MRALLAGLTVLVLARPAGAEPLHRLEVGAGTGSAVGTSGHALSFTYEGGVRFSPHVAFVGHFGIAMLTDRRMDDGESDFPMDFVGHGMLELHLDRVLVGAGLGFDMTHYASTYIQPGKHPVSIGANAQVGVDVVQTTQGTFGLFVAATKVQLGALVFHAYARQDMTTATVGVSYRPR